MTSQVSTIYEWAGGQPAFERWLGRFYDLVENDVLLAPLSGINVREQHRRNVVTWWCEVTRAPSFLVGIVLVLAVGTRREPG